jgi:hypothetical protein
MEIEDVKLWHWMLAGVIAGALFSCIAAWSGPKYDAQERDTIEAGEFENAVYGLTKFNDLARFSSSGAARQLQNNVERFHKGQSRVRYLTVHLPLAGDPKHTYWVTGETYSIGRRNKDANNARAGYEDYQEWKPFKYPAPSPYKPGYQEHVEKKHSGSPEMNAELAELKTALGGNDTFPTVVEFLKAVAALPNPDKANPNVHLDFSQSLWKPIGQAWWERPAALWGMPPLAGFLMIGVAWPMTLSILQSFGVAKPAPVKAKPKAIAKPEPMRVPSTAGVVVIPSKPAPPPLPSDAKKYGGEFYPVVKIADEKAKPAVTKTK